MLLAGKAGSLRHDLVRDMPCAWAGMLLASVEGRTLVFVVPAAAAASQLLWGGQLSNWLAGQQHMGGKFPSMLSFDLRSECTLWVPPGWAAFLFTLQAGTQDGKVLMVPYASVGLIETAFMGAGDREWVRRTLCAQIPVDPVSQSPLPPLAAAVRDFAQGIQEIAEQPDREALGDRSASASGDSDMGEATSDVEALRIEALAKTDAAAHAGTVSPLPPADDTPCVNASPLPSAPNSSATADPSPAAQDTQPAAGPALDWSGLGQ